MPGCASHDPEKKKKLKQAFIDSSPGGTASGILSIFFIIMIVIMMPLLAYVAYNCPYVSRRWETFFALFPLTTPFYLCFRALYVCLKR